ncbi:hypothetical protein [Aliiglaciecola litoralis]|uniref:hypothetical protein n=1 Tax=Aliiglaciecola litoralis TaxID=582857 RepID=UPI0031D4E6A3
MGFFAVVVVAVLLYVTFSNTPSVSPVTVLPSPISSQSITEPKFSYLDILQNDEFKDGMQKAVMDSDIELAKTLQAKAIEIANAAQLPDAEIQILSDERGLNYMLFLAKRQLFIAAFERRYLALEGIQDIKLIYPEAQNLFARSDALIAQRDQMINDIAKEMAGGNDIGDYLQKAKDQWKLVQSAHQKVKSNP